MKIWSNKNLRKNLILGFFLVLQSIYLWLKYNII